MQVAGDHYLQVLLEGSAGHDPETVEPTYTGPAQVPAPGACDTATEVVRTGEFEAIYNWTVGVDGEAPFRVSTLSVPSRLVIDLGRS